MIPYEIKQKEVGLKRAYENLMKQLNDFITLRAKEGLPFSSLVGFKRNLYRFKKVINPVAAVNENNSFQRNNKELDSEIGLLTEDVFNKMGVDVLDAVKARIIDEKGLKKVLLKYDYQHMAKQGMKYKTIKKILSEKYGVSVSSIEKMVYRK